MKISEKLVNLTGCNSARELSQRLGVSPQAVAMWRKVPPARVIQLHKMYGLPLDVLETLHESQQVN